MPEEKSSSQLDRITREDFAFLRKRIESGKVILVVERTYPLRETAEAMRFHVWLLEDLIMGRTLYVS
jgi:hypothetical protein